MYKYQLDEVKTQLAPGARLIPPPFSLPTPTPGDGLAAYAIRSSPFSPLSLLAPRSYHSVSCAKLMNVSSNEGGWQTGMIMHMVAYKYKIYAQLFAWEQDKAGQARGKTWSLRAIMADYDPWAA
ncbi:hypothetical protein L198_03487 [Cryptococcus wingfieldii CBS 7118]|uniref:Uncharacterized protein n=1 Tax=Cryptococcus wingfieldii CBS 7118 TaxID=1295528 RepID=A0A1E3JC52_9TREE|nr:hypothetical protein L198_03487 [Cryptococcus wingfieldii CBS 7118]ODN98245.1 hypothetical protein L198_03487 [Cryptococcus wingfieldii CBS 7118]